MPLNKRKVNLFIVGEPKCATTSIASYLKEHPEICISTIKEPNYFSKDIQEESDKYHGKKRFYPYRKYEEYSKCFKCEGEKIIGEASTDYSYSEIALKRIFEYNPKAKIIIGLRNPPDLLDSLHNQEKVVMNENIDNFEDALNAENQRKNGKRLPKTARQPSVLYYSKRIDFPTHLKRILKYCDNKNVFVYLYEDFSNNPEKIYFEILDFLGVRKKKIKAYKKYNKRREKRFFLLRNILYSKPVKEISSYLPRGLYIVLSETLRRFMSREKRKKGLSQTLRKKVMKRYKEMVIETNKILRENRLTDKDLVKYWEYDKV